MIRPPPRSTLFPYTPLSRFWGQHLVFVRAPVGGAPAPLLPHRLGAGERRVGVLDRRPRLVREMPRENEPLTSALDHVELGTHGPVLHLARERRRQAKLVGHRGL